MSEGTFLEESLLNFKRLSLISSDNRNALAFLKIDLGCLVYEPALAGLLSSLSTQNQVLNPRPECRQDEAMSEQGNNIPLFQSASLVKLKIIKSLWIPRSVPCLNRGIHPASDQSVRCFWSQTYVPHRHSH